MDEEYLRELFEYGYYDLFDRSKMIDIDVDLMLERFSKHWISLEDVLKRMGASSEVFDKTLRSSIISFNRYTYYTICDLGQIDLKDCIINYKVVIYDEEIEEEYSFNITA